MTTAGDDRPIGAPEQLARQLEEVAANVGSVLYGKRDVVRLTLACLAAEGHLLIEDLPGVGKTTLAKALAQTLGLHCRRVQFTADLLPSDLIGAMVLDRERMTPVFHPGPVFTNILLADELNRASPKAQSALLEAMEEGQVSVDGVTRQLPKPFMVIATQNPYDSAGTYPLPFSQRDRFLLRTSIGYPGRQAEDRLLATAGARPRPESLKVIGGAAMLKNMAAAVDNVFVAPEVRAYVLDLVQATRHHPSLLFGASPRAGMALLRTASGFAVTAGRDYLRPDDVKAVAEVVLGHRLAVTSSAELAGSTSSSLIAELLATTPVPVRAQLPLGSRRSGLARRATLTTRGVIALGLTPVSALAGALLGAEELVLVSIALFLLLLGGLVQCAHRASRDANVWRVGVDLSASDVEVGGLLTVRVTVGASEGGGTTPVWLEAPDWGWFPAGTGAVRRPLPNPALVRRVPPLESGTTAPFSSVAPTWSRGVFTLEPLRLWCPDSFGLVARAVVSGPRATVTVYPAPIPVDLDEDLFRGETGAEESQSLISVARRGHDSLGDFSGIRPYVPGDRLRLLFWPALARRDELMVRDFEDSGSHRVRVVADIRPLIGAAGCESVLATAAGVGLAALERGSVVELSTTAGEQIAVGPGPHGPLALLRAVATITTGATPDPSRRRLRRRPTEAGSGPRDLPPPAGTQLVVTTEVGAQTMAGPFGSAHLVIAP